MFGCEPCLIKQVKTKAEKENVKFDFLYRPISHGSCEFCGIPSDCIHV